MLQSEILTKETVRIELREKKVVGFDVHRTAFPFILFCLKNKLFLYICRKVE